MKYDLLPGAIARIRGGSGAPGVSGFVRFFQQPDGVTVETVISGLPETATGFFAFHVHEGDSCDGPGFDETGGHFNPGEKLHPAHAGDLPPLLGNHGRAYMCVFTDRFSVDDVVGRTVIIHDSFDDFHTQPSGNAGAKIACGVIRKL